MMVRRRIFLVRGGLLVALLALAIAVYGYREARRDPLVRRTTIALADWPPGARPVRVALVSDIHIASAAMDAPRLARIVAQVNALHPDLVLLAGDFIYGNDRHNAARFAPELIAPLGGLRAPLGVLAVAGNHDHQTGLAQVSAALAQAHVRLLANQAVLRGPLAVAGIDDNSTGHARLPATMRQLERLHGARIAFTHAPDIAYHLPKGLPVLLAGHTHCGQVVVPGMARFVPEARNFRCGRIAYRHHIIVVTAGIGTSGPPIRIGAPPDLWLITFGPPPGGVSPKRY